MLPALGLVLAFVAYPLGSVVFHAFTSWDGIAAPEWVGFANFEALIDDPVFRTSLRNNVLFAISVPIQVTVPMVLAWLIHERIPGWRFFRSTFFLPAVISTVVVGLVAQVVFRLNGPLNSSSGASACRRSSRTGSARRRRRSPRSCSSSCGRTSATTR